MVSNGRNVCIFVVRFFIGKVCNFKFNIVILLDFLCVVWIGYNIGCGCGICDK